MELQTRKVFLAILIICMTASMAMAQRNTVELEADGWVFDYDPNYPNSAKPDTIVSVVYPWAEGGSDPIIESDQALYLGDRASAWYRFADEPLFGELSFYVYDKGAYVPSGTPAQGPRFGVQNNPSLNPVNPTATPSEQLMGAELTWIGNTGNANYAFANSTIECAPCIPSQPGPYPQPDAYRRVDGASIANPISLTENVQGAWAKWTLTVHEMEDMLITITDADGESNMQQWTVIPRLDSNFDTGFSTTGFNQVHFFGGKSLENGFDDHVGLWVDRVEFTPDPGQDANGFCENFGTGWCGTPPIIYCYSVGDFNCDGEVGLLDLDMLGMAWHQYVTPCTNGDANCDGYVDLLDLDIIGKNWGQTVVPEPATLGLLAAGSLLAIRRR